MEEKTFFEDGGVKVTNTRFITGDQTYAMSNITSVKAYEMKPSRIPGIFILLLGIMVTGSAPEFDGQFLLGTLTIGGAVAHMYMQKSVYHVILATSGGETSALNTYERTYRDNVVSALSEAIVYRG